MNDILELKMVTVAYDNGDGSMSINAYNTEDEAWKDSYLYEDNKDEEEDKLAELKEYFLSGDDGYENGWPGTETFKVRLVDGKLELAKPASFYSNNQ